jgi:hypothetical protein
VGGSATPPARFRSGPSVLPVGRAGRLPCRRTPPHTQHARRARHACGTRPPSRTGHRRPLPRSPPLRRASARKPGRDGLGRIFSGLTRIRVIRVRAGPPDPDAERDVPPPARSEARSALGAVPPAPPWRIDPDTPTPSAAARFPLRRAGSRLNGPRAGHLSGLTGPRAGSRLGGSSTAAALDSAELGGDRRLAFTPPEWAALFTQPESAALRASGSLHSQNRRPFLHSRNGRPF